MEINLRQLSSQVIESTSATKKMRLSEHAQSMVFQLFTKSVYSNPIGTVVREIASNCFDSHTEAKVNSPVLIKKSKDAETGTEYISFIDYGVGMSPTRIENTYMVYFESTKRLDNSQIGGFGIGGKTPLAYKRSTGKGETEYDNSFYVITNYDGIRYYYLVFEGTDSPEVTLLHSETTPEHNGTEVRIPVLPNDMYKFEKELTRQLYYFENIIFEGFNTGEVGTYSYTDTDAKLNAYQIVRGKNFLFRGNEYSDYIHICLGRVAYPIDYNVLGLSASDYRIPVALRLEVGDINVTVSRESVDYSDSTIKMLKKKLEDVKEEVKELLIKQYSNVQTLEEYFEVRKAYGKLMFSNGNSINVGAMVNRNDIKFSKFKYESFNSCLDDAVLFKFFFTSKMYGKSKPKRRSKYSNNFVGFTGSYESLMKCNQYSNVFRIDGEFNRKTLKQAYLKSIHSNYYIISKNDVSKWTKSDIADLFNIQLIKFTDDNNNYAPVVKLLIDMQEEYFKIVQRQCTNYDSIVVPDTFAIARKRNMVTEEIKKLPITIKIFNEGRYNKNTIKLMRLIDFKEPIFYGFSEDEDRLKIASRLVGKLFKESYCIDSWSNYYEKWTHDNKKRLMFVQIAKGNEKHLKFCKNAKHISEVYNSLLYRKADMVQTYYQTKELFESFKNIPELYKCKGFNGVNAKLGSKVTTITEFLNKIKPQHDLSYSHYDLSNYFKTERIPMTKEQTKIGNEINEIKKIVAKNSEMLRYITLPYDNNEFPTMYAELLKKVMVFK